MAKIVQQMESYPRPCPASRAVGHAFGNPRLDQFPTHPNSGGCHRKPRHPCRPCRFIALIQKRREQVVAEVGPEATWKDPHQPTDTHRPLQPNLSQSRAGGRARETPVKTAVGVVEAISPARASVGASDGLFFSQVEGVELVARPHGGTLIRGGTREGHSKGGRVTAERRRFPGGRRGPDGRRSSGPL